MARCAPAGNCSAGRSARCAPVAQSDPTGDVGELDDRGLGIFGLAVLAGAVHTPRHLEQGCIAQLRGALAGSYDLEEGTVKARFSDIGAVGEADVDPVTWVAASETPEGELSPPHRTGETWQIIKVVDRIRNSRLAQARGGIVSILTDEYERSEIKKYTQRLFERYSVSFPGKLPLFHLKPLNLRPNQQGS